MVQKLILPLPCQVDKPNFDVIDVNIPDFDSEFFCLWLSKVVKHYGKAMGEISFVFVTDVHLLKINKEYLKHDYYTDIITFDYNEGNSLNGDLMISYDRVMANAIEFGNGSVWDELCRVMVHGVLHLIGFADKTDEEILLIRKEEDFCLTLR